MIRAIAFWALLPFVIPQALWVRRTAVRFARAGGPTAGVAGQGRTLKLVGLGDSIICGVGANQLVDALVGRTARELADRLHRQVSWVADGRIGANARMVLDRLPTRALEPAADIFLVSVGVNDVTGLRTVSAWKHDVARILTVLTRHSPGAVIALVGIPPLGGFPALPQPLRALLGLRARTLDLAARRLLTRFPAALHVPVTLVPAAERFAADGYHPSAAGYREFGRFTAELVARKFEERRA